MKRPFAVIGFSALAALMIAVFMGETVALAVSGVSMVIFLVLIFVKKRLYLRKYRVMAAVLATVSLSLFLYAYSVKTNYQPYQVLDGKKAVITGEIQGYPESRFNRFYYKVRISALKIDDKTVECKPFMLRLSASNFIDAEPYDEIKTTVKFFAHQEKFGFSSKTSYWAKGIPISAYMSDYQAEIKPNPHKPILYYFEKFSHYLVKQIKLLLPPEEAALTNAMLIGDRSDVSADVDFAFRKTGTTHLLVVSGMHTTLVAAFILALLSFFKIPQKLANFITIFAVIAFVLMTGLQSSVLRSGLMTILFLLAQLADRESDSVNTLGLAVVFICLFQPQIGGDIGFLLSVFATLGILKFAKPLQDLLMSPFKKFNKFKRIVKAILSSLAVSLAATLFILPIQIYLFGGLSLVGPLATLILSIPSALMLYFAFFLLVFHAIFPPLAVPFTFLTGICAKFSIWAVNQMAEWDGYIGFMQGFGLIALCAILLIAAILFWIRPTVAVKRTALVMSAVFLMTTVISHHFKYQNSITLAVSQSGEPPCVLVMQNGKAVILAAEGYNPNAIRDIFMQNNINEVSGIVLASDTRETVTAVDEVIKRYPVAQLAIQDDVYLPRNLRENWQGIPKLKYTEQTMPSWLESIEWSITRHSISLSYKNTRILLEIGTAAEQDTDILITPQKNSLVNSPFTVLLTDDIIESNKLDSLEIGSRHEVPPAATPAPPISEWNNDIIESNKLDSLEIGFRHEVPPAATAAPLISEIESDKLDSLEKKSSHQEVLVTENQNMVIFSEEVKPGTYILSNQQRVTYIDIFPHHKIQIRRAE